MGINKSNAIWPIAISLFFVGGFYLGSFNGGDASYNPAYHQMARSGNKFNQILDYVEQEYVDSMDREALVDETIQLMLQKLDPHSYYISASELSRMSEPLEGSFEGIGIQFSIQKDTIVVITPISGGPSEKKGIMAGDRIVTVDTVNVAGVNISNSRVMKLLKGKGGTEVSIQIKRPGATELLDFDIVRDKIPIYSVDVGYMINDETAYIKVSRFSKTTYEEFVDISRHLLRQGMENLILDLRNNGGGYMDGAINIADEFLPEDQLIVYTEGRARSKQKYYATDRGSLEDVGLVVLIDEGSASASEILAGAIQDNDRGMIMGRRSFGKGLVQEQSNWPDGSATRLTIARYYTPTGRCIQKPYGEDQNEYHNDYSNRVESGQLSDSSAFEFNDSLKFTTPGGKIVYGGGGIMPDRFIPIDTAGTSMYLTRLFYRGLFYQFSFDYADKHRKELNVYGSVENFIDQFRISPGIEEEFVNFANESGIPRDDEGLSISREIIQSQIKAGIARNIYGNEGYYPFVNQIDHTVDEAIKVLDTSSNLSAAKKNG